MQIDTTEWRDGAQPSNRMLGTKGMRGSLSTQVRLWWGWGGRPSGLWDEHAPQEIQLLQEPRLLPL